MPDDPLRIEIDHTLLDQLGWRPGDRITFEPTDLDRRTCEGGLVIRRAIAEEPAITLKPAHFERRKHPYADLFPGRAYPDHLRFGPDGPGVRWPFRSKWIETFFPLEYIPGPGAPIFDEPDRTWLLRDLLDQRERVVVPLTCSLLEFRLQRTDPNVPTLDVHLPAGVLHLMGWSTATPLALTSGNGFNPSVPEDILTIRRSLPGESNLAWDGAKFIASPSPDWLARYFPGFHDNAEELPRHGPSPIQTGSESDSGDPDFLSFLEDQAPNREFSFAEEERDTFCVHFSGFGLEMDSLSFAIPERSHVWD